MPQQISLADFNRIATGTYNAGQIDFATGKDAESSAGDTGYKFHIGV